MNIWWKIWWSALAVKLALAAGIPLTPDEAYYWVWTQHPQLSYFDHPPAVAWLLTLGDLLPSWAVRWPAVLLVHCSLWFWTQIAARWLNPSQLVWFLILSLLMPLTGMGSLIVTPDLPLLFAWSFSLWALFRLVRDGGKKSDAALFGLGLGLGCLSKYHIVLMGPIAFYFWWSSPNRPPLKNWLPTTIVIALLVSTPVWLWNLQNDWASFRFQLDHGLGRKVWKPSWTTEYVLAQIGLIFPTMIWLAARSKSPFAIRMMAWFPLAFFFFTSFRGYVEANWPIVAHPMILILAAEQLTTHRRWLQVTASVWSVALAAVLVLLFLPNWPEAIHKTKLRDLRQYDSLIQKTREFTPLYARSYQMASTLSFAQKREVYKLRGMNRRDFFDSLPGSVPDADRIYLAVQQGDSLPEPWIKWKVGASYPIDEHFQVWELIRP